jgi:hypothetical protein
MKEISSMSGSNSYTAQRILAGVVALSLTAYALGVIRTQLQFGIEPIGVSFGLGAAVVATLCWWFALRGHIAESRVRMRFTVIGGLLLGGIAFAVGFFGSIILVPGDNLDPLLGVFVTGPLGFVLGAVMSWLYACLRTRVPRPA